MTTIEVIKPCPHPDHEYDEPDTTDIWNTAAYCRPHNPEDSGPHEGAVVIQLTEWGEIMGGNQGPRHQLDRNPPAPPGATGGTLYVVWEGEDT